MGGTDSEGEADTAEDLERIEAAAAAISQRLEQSHVAQVHEEIQVLLLHTFVCLPSGSVGEHGCG